MNINDIRDLLRSTPTRYPSVDFSEIISQIAMLKLAAVSSGDECTAKELWCLEETARAQELFVHSFQLMKDEKFYEGWCELEQAEMCVLRLRRHWSDHFPEYHLSEIESLIVKFQALFPYKAFLSPEILEKEKRCSICKKIITIRRPCGHEVGEIYNGEHCHRIVTEMEVLGIS